MLAHTMAERSRLILQRLACLLSEQMRPLRFAEGTLLLHVLHARAVVLNSLSLVTALCPASCQPAQRCQPVPGSSAAHVLPLCGAGEGAAARILPAASLFCSSWGKLR